LREAKGDFGCDEFQDADTFLKDTLACAWLWPEETLVHLLKGDVLEAKHAFRVVISNNNTIHISYPRLEAGMTLVEYPFSCTQIANSNLYFKNAERIKS
jgi:hypothetical protein